MLKYLELIDKDIVISEQRSKQAKSFPGHVYLNTVVILFNP